MPRITYNINCDGYTIYPGSQQHHSIFEISEKAWDKLREGLDRIPCTISLNSDEKIKSAAKFIDDAI